MCEDGKKLTVSCGQGHDAVCVLIVRLVPTWLSGKKTAEQRLYPYNRIKEPLFTFFISAGVKTVHTVLSPLQRFISINLINSVQFQRSFYSPRTRFTVIIPFL